MIDVYFWPTGNGKKVTIMLEECELEYNVIPVNINKGDQSTPAYAAINPNNKMPALIDRDAPGGPITVFESGAIQVGGLGPMAGQAHQFLRYAPERIEYPMHRFRTEVTRLYRVMDKQLARNEYLAGEYSIADIAARPWVVRNDWQGQDLNDTPHVKRWFEAVGARPAVRRGAEVGKDLANFSQPMSDEDRKRLFNLRDEDLESARP